MSLTEAERRTLCNKICYFQAADVRQEFEGAIDIVKSEIEDKIKALNEEAKWQRELLIDMLVCFLPPAKLVIGIVESEDLVEKAVDEAMTELAKTVTKEKLFTDSQQQQLAYMTDYADLMYQGFRQRLELLHDFVMKEQHIIDPVKLPDRLLKRLEDKFSAINFERKKIAEQIRSHLSLLEKYIFSFGTVSSLDYRNNENTWITSLELRQISGYGNNGIVYMPVYKTTSKTKYAQPVIDFNTGRSSSERLVVINEFIPLIFLDLAINAAKSKANEGAFYESDQVWEYKNPDFLRNFYGKDAGKMSSSSSKRGEHFKYSLLKRVTRNSNVFGYDIRLNDYIRIRRKDRFEILQIEEF